MNELMLLKMFIFFFGACVGSFLNVCIVRLPKEESIVWPNSHCVACQKPLAWFDNIPLFSYFILNGRCRYCKAQFSVRYFLVELITGLSFLGFFEYFGPSWITLAYWVMISGFIVATFVDFEHRIIPDEVSIGGTFVGLGLSFLIPQLQEVRPVIGSITHWAWWLPHFQALGYSFVGALVGGGMVYVMGILGNLIIPRSKRQIDYISKVEFAEIMHPLKADVIERLWDNLIRSGYIKDQGEVLKSFWQVKKAEDLQLDASNSSFKKKIYKALRMDTMGGGDVKLMAMVGAFLGWKLAILTFFLAPFLGAVYGIIEKIRTKDSAIAYGPFLVLGALLSLFYGNQIILWILSGYGLR